MKINREELKQYLLNNFDCYADMDEHYDAEVIPALTIEQAVDLFEQYVSERAKTDETSDKHEPKQLNILGVSESLHFDNLLIELQELSDIELEALRLVYEKEQGSVSLIQRRLKMGYRQADNIIDKLFNAGYITEYNGAKPRKITKHKKMMLNGIRLVLNSR